MSVVSPDKTQSGRGNFGRVAEPKEGGRSSWVIAMKFQVSETSTDGLRLHYPGPEHLLYMIKGKPMHFLRIARHGIRGHLDAVVPIPGVGHRVHDANVGTDPRTR